MLGEVDLLGIGSQIKDKGTRSKACRVGGTNEVGKAELFTYADKEARSEITGGFFDQLQGGSVSSTGGGAKVSLHDHGLLLLTLCRGLY